MKNSFEILLYSDIFAHLEINKHTLQVYSYAVFASYDWFNEILE